MVPYRMLQRPTAAGGAHTRGYKDLNLHSSASTIPCSSRTDQNTAGGDGNSSMRHGWTAAPAQTHIPLTRSPSRGLHS